MIKGLHHICFSVSDIKNSLVFYDYVMPRMGFRERKSAESKAYVIDEFEIYLQASKKPEYKHERFGLGVQHLAFHAPSREAVDNLFKALQEIKCHISDPPKEYPEYNPGYYAVFFQDPDGITLEYCFTPGFEF